MQQTPSSKTITPPCKPQTHAKCKRHRIGQCIECGLVKKQEKPPLNEK